MSILSLILFWLLCVWYFNENLFSSLVISLTLSICLGIMIEIIFLLVFWKCKWLWITKFSSLKWVLAPVIKIFFLLKKLLILLSKISYLMFLLVVNFRFPRFLVFVAPSFTSLALVSVFCEKQTSNFLKNFFWKVF